MCWGGRSFKSTECTCTHLIIILQPKLIKYLLNDRITGKKTNVILHTYSPQSLSTHPLSAHPLSALTNLSSSSSSAPTASSMVSLISSSFKSIISDYVYNQSTPIITGGKMEQEWIFELTSLSKSIMIF